jgi:dTDP-glucose 4,6-dehydratase
MGKGYPDTVLVTGGAGFIGSAVVRRLLRDGKTVINVDKLTYAASKSTVDPLPETARYTLEVADIADGAALSRILDAHKPDAVMHLAGDTHVDRSIDRPSDFVRNNIVGSVTLLDAAYRYWQALPSDRQARFRFHQISTEEVFGPAGPDSHATEDSPYRPSNPYAASKAGADHVVRAWHRTYGLPILITNSCNNYGPRQFPEKLIPLMILNAIEGKPLPVYGTGMNRRNWLYVDDHAAALCLIVARGKVGESYNIGGDAERTNVDVVRTVCTILDEVLPRSDYRPHANLINFVADRPGHDLRYAIDDGKLRTTLGWRPAETLSTGLEKTVRWYLENRAWWQPIRERTYRGERLGQVEPDAAKR